MCVKFEKIYDVIFDDVIIFKKKFNLFWKAFVDVLKLSKFEVYWITLSKAMQILEICDLKDFSLIL